MTINKEGYTIIATAALIVAAINVATFFLLPTLFFWIILVITVFVLCFIAAFFREPSRPHVQDPDLVYSPADGTVVVSEVVDEDEFLSGKRIQVSVFMSVTNVHVNWYPVSGRLAYFKHHHGKYMVAWHPKSSEDNERTTTVIDTGRHQILFRQVAGLVARRIVSYAEVGTDVEQNTKCGFIKFGSRLDVMLPEDSEVLVKIGQKVTGSQTPLARLK